MKKSIITWALLALTAGLVSARKALPVGFRGQHRHFECNEAVSRVQPPGFHPSALPGCDLRLAFLGENQIDRVPDGIPVDYYIQSDVISLFL